MKLQSIITKIGITEVSESCNRHSFVSDHLFSLWELPPRLIYVANHFGQWAAICDTIGVNGHAVMPNGEGESALSHATSSAWFLYGQTTAILLTIEFFAI